MGAKRIIFDSSRVGPWVCYKTNGHFDSVGSSVIGLLDDERLVAGVVYDNYNTRSVQMHVAAEAGARWMTKRFLWVCFDYPFNQLKVNKIIGLVDSTNLPARKFDEHLGFHLEYTIKDVGRYGDVLVYTMTRDQCRFIGGTNGKQIVSATDS